MVIIYSGNVIRILSRIYGGIRLCCDRAEDGEGGAMRPSFFCWAYETRKSLNGDKDIQICDTILVIGGVS